MVNAVGSSVSTMQMEIVKDLQEMQNSVSSPSTQEASGGGEFAAVLEKSLTEVNTLLTDADAKGVAVATGKSENVHDAMISFEKAESAMKLMMQVRNKTLDAYHEILRMQF